MIIPMMITEDAALIQRDRHRTHQIQDVQKAPIVIQVIQVIQLMENDALQQGWKPLGSVLLVSVLIDEHAGAS